jgi:choline dehydrogenase-like flavoprotein
MHVTDAPDCDVLIVGAGVAGALIAWRLAQAGAKVILLEAGGPAGHRLDSVQRYYAHNTLGPAATYPPDPGAPIPTIAALQGDWKDARGRYLVQEGPLAYQSLYQRITGGTTQHFNGTSLRNLPQDFTLHSTYGVKGAVDWPIAYADLAPYYTQAEAALGVCGDTDAWRAFLEAAGAPDAADFAFPMPPLPASYSDQQVGAVLDTTPIDYCGQPVLAQVLTLPQFRNSVPYDGRPPCMGNTSCTPVCPIAAKYDAGVHLEKAVRAGAELRPHAIVWKLDVRADDRQIERVHYKTPDGRDHAVSARLYVMAASAVETPKILLMSRSDACPRGVANESGQIGKNLMDHFVYVAYGSTREPVFPYRGTLATSGIQAFRDGAFRASSAAFSVELGNSGWAAAVGGPTQRLQSWLFGEGRERPTPYGTALREKLAEQTTREIAIAFQVEALPMGERSSVRPSETERDSLGIPRPVIRYAMSEYTERGFMEAMRTGQSIFEALGATLAPNTCSGCAGPGEPLPASCFVASDGTCQTWQPASHLMGTHRMGSDPRSSVTDAETRAWDHPNLFMAGGGLFPSSGTANPTLTIAALALRTAQTLVRAL